MDNLTFIFIIRMKLSYRAIILREKRKKKKKKTNTAQKEGGGRDFGPMIFKITSVPKRIHVHAWIRPSLKGINVIGGRDEKYSSL